MKLRVASQTCDPFDIEPSGEELFIGRSSSCDLVIPHQGISRRHARLYRNGFEWMLEDLGSTNLTYVGDDQITETTRLKVGDIIRLAPSKSDYTVTILEIRDTPIFSDPGSQTVTQLASTLLDELNAPLSDSAGEGLRNHAQRLMIFSQANGKLARATDRVDLAERLLDQLFTFIDADAAVIYLTQPNGEFEVAAMRPAGGVPPLSQTLVQEITGPGMAMFANDLSVHHRLAQSHSLADSNLHALVASPLFEESTIYGIAAAYSFSLKRCFDESHMKLLVGLAAAASMRLHNIILTEEAARSLQETNKRLEEMVTERTRELRQKNKQILASLDYARHIQEAILPRPEKLNEMFSEGFVISMPRDIVSGDFYWGGWQGDYAMVALVDCTGHGVPGAFMSMVGYTLLNKIINEQGINDPAQILEQLNYEVRIALKQEEASIGAADGMEMGLCRVDCQTRELCFAGARFDLYIASVGEPLKVFKGNRQSIGGKQRKHFSGFVNQSVRLIPGEHVYMFTDGFADQPNAALKRFGTGTLKKLLCELTSKGINLPDQKEALLKALTEHREDTVQRDDISALGFTLTDETLN